MCPLCCGERGEQKRGRQSARERACVYGSCPLRSALPPTPLVCVCAHACVQTLYYCPLNGNHLYSIPTRFLRDFTTTDAFLASQVLCCVVLCCVV
jgi:hypothetical protein